jgi:hypothetical protein
LLTDKLSQWRGVMAVAMVTVDIIGHMEKMDTAEMVLPH